MHEDRMFVVESQKVILSDEIKGNRILDIGGGGEGVIGLCYNNRVISIDPNKEELEEAADGPLKVIMDARNLFFLDKSFDTVTSFFTLMYINKDDHLKVFNEIYRVLKDDSEFIMWDAAIPKFNDNSKKDIYVVKFEVDTPHKVISTGYGVLWKNNEQNLDYYVKLGKKAGFEVSKTIVNEHTFKITFKKS